MTTETESRSNDKPPADFVRIPPPSSGRKSSPESSPTTRRGGGRKRSYKKPLEEMIASVGIGVYAVNEADGAAILNGAENLASALDNLAKEDERVRRIIDKMLTGSAYGAVIMASAAIILPILDNHGLLPVKLPAHINPANGPKDGSENGG